MLHRQIRAAISPHPGFIEQFASLFPNSTAQWEPLKGPHSAAGGMFFDTFLVPPGCHDSAISPVVAIRSEPNI